MGWFRRHWRALIGAVSLALSFVPAFLKIVVAIISRGGDADFIITRLDDPSWVGVMVNWLIDFASNPPPNTILPLIAAGLILIWWDLKRSRPVAIHKPSLTTKPSSNLEFGSVRLLYNRQSNGMRIIAKTSEIEMAEAEIDTSSVIHWGGHVLKCIFTSDAGPFRVKVHARTPGIMSDETTIAHRIIENDKNYISIHLMVQSVLVSSQNSTDIKVTFFRAND